MNLYNKLVKACSVYLYGHMYPHLKEDLHILQLSDLVRTFFAGVLEGYIATDNRQAVEELIPYYEKMAEKSWLPGPEFKRPRNRG